MLIAISSGQNIVIPYAPYICKQSKEERNLKSSQIYSSEMKYQNFEYKNVIAQEQGAMV